MALDKEQPATCEVEVHRNDQGAFERCDRPVPCPVHGSPPVPSPSTVDEARKAVWVAFEIHAEDEDCDGRPEQDALDALVAAVRREVEQEAAAAAEELWGEPAVDEDWQARAEAAEAALESERTHRERLAAAAWAVVRGGRENIVPRIDALRDALAAAPGESAGGAAPR